MYSGELLLTLGGLGALFLAVLYFVMKRAISAAIDKSVNNVFDKKLERYKTELLRATQIHSFVIERQMELFDQINKNLAELVPLIQDMAQSVENREFTEYHKSCYLRFLELMPEMKQSVLEFEPYVDRNIYESITSLVITMQESSEAWYKRADLLSSGSLIDDSEVESARAQCDDLLKMIALARVLMKEYLDSATSTELS